jgi:hypothetical protein
MEYASIIQPNWNWSDGVLEYWIRTGHYSIAPVLHHSKIPILSLSNGNKFKYNLKIKPVGYKKNYA